LGKLVTHLEHSILVYTFSLAIKDRNVLYVEIMKTGQVFQKSLEKKEKVAEMILNKFELYG